jgi:hypothetical protein
MKQIVLGGDEHVWVYQRPCFACVELNGSAMHQQYTSQSGSIAHAGQQEQTFGQTQ